MIGSAEMGFPLNRRTECPGSFAHGAEQRPESANSFEKKEPAFNGLWKRLNRTTEFGDSG